MIKNVKSQAEKMTVFSVSAKSRIRRMEKQKPRESLSGLINRRRWDSNPRALAGYLISSQGRYDHFDTPPQSPDYYSTIRRNIQIFFK